MHLISIFELNRSNVRYTHLRAIFQLSDGFYFVSIGYILKKLWYFKVIGYKVQNVSPMA